MDGDGDVSGGTATTPRMTFVTVAFESEIPLLMLQARSMARLLGEPIVAAIVVIDNTERGMSAATLRRLRHHYGPLAPFVHVLRPDAICTDLPATSGWVRQQVLKLAVADVAVATDFYVALDAKNHLVSTPTWDFFVSSDGRARVPVYSFVEHPLRAHLERVLDYTGLPRTHLAEFTSTVTPFVLETRRARLLLHEVERRAGRPFALEFVEQELAEFFLYSAWIVAGGESLDAVFDRTVPRCPIVWPRHANVQGVDAAVEESLDGGCPFFSVHRRALLTLDRAGTARLAQFWAGTGLFSSTGRARWFVRRFRLGVLRAHAVRKVAGTPRIARRRLLRQP